MYYDSQRKLAFVMPPKTGSTTLGRLLDSFEIQKHSLNIRMFPEEAIQSNFEFANYKFLGFFRNPLDRFMSLCRQIHGIKNKFDYSNFSYDLYIDDVNEDRVKYVYSPQVKWLKNAEIFDFSNYDAELLRVANLFGIQEITVRKLNSTIKLDQVPSQKVIDFVQSYYADDYRLGQERGLLK